MVEYRNYLKRFKALADKDPCADAINYRRNRRMCGALQEIDGNCRFRGIIHTERNAYSLNPRLIYQAANVSFLRGHCLIDFLFSHCWKRLIRLSVEDQASPDSINRGRNSWDRGPRDMYQQSAFACVIGARAHCYGLYGRILSELGSAPLQHRCHALAFLRNQCGLRNAYLCGTGRGSMCAADRVIRTTHNGER